MNWASIFISQFIIMTIRGFKQRTRREEMEKNDV